MLASVWWKSMYSSGNPCPPPPLSLLSFPSLVAVLSPHRHTVPIKCISQIPDYNSLCQSMRSALGVRRWLNCPVSTRLPLLPPPSPVRLSALASWLSSQLTPPRLGNTSTCNTTPARARSHRAKHNTPAACLSLSLSLSHTHTHTHNTADQRHKHCSERSGLPTNLSQRRRCFPRRLTRLQFSWEAITRSKSVPAKQALCLWFLY